MDWYRNSRRMVALWIAVAVMVMALPLAMAGDTGEELDRLEQRLESLEADAEDAAEEELELAKKWLNEARELHERQSRYGVEQRLRRVDHVIDLLQARVDTERIRESIEQQHAAHETSTEQIERLKEEIEDLQAQREERQQELERLREDD